MLNQDSNPKETLIQFILAAIIVAPIITYFILFAANGFEHPKRNHQIQYYSEQKTQEDNKVAFLAKKHDEINKQNL